MNNAAIEISNVGPIDQIKIPVPEGGGIVVFRGRNGAGKTLALEAIDAAVTGKGRVPVRDGEIRGEVVAHGVTMRIGRSTRRDGEAEVHSLEGRLSVADLVDPGLKDVASADAARIKALVGLLGPPADLKVFGISPAIELSPATRDATHLVDMAARIKRDLEAAARVAETAAENARRDVDIARNMLGDDDPSWAQPEPKMDEALERSIERRAELQGRQQEALETTKRAAASKQALDDAIPKGADATPTVAEAGLVFEQAMEAVRSAELARFKAENQLAAATSHKKITDRWREDIDAARAAAEASVTDDEIQAADCAVVDARDAADRARRGRGAEVHADALAKCEAKRDENDAEATRLRGAGQSVDDVLSEIIKGAGIDLSVKVVDGRVRLVTETDRGVTCFGELSPGERWRIALDVAAEALGSGGELTIPQDAWEAMDPANKAAIATHVQELGIIAYTAEADVGPLRAEAMSLPGDKS